MPSDCQSCCLVTVSVLLAAFACGGDDETFGNSRDDAGFDTGAASNTGGTASGGSTSTGGSLASGPNGPAGGQAPVGSGGSGFFPPPQEPVPCGLLTCTPPALSFGVTACCVNAITSTCGTSVGGGVCTAPTPCGATTCSPPLFAIGGATMGAPCCADARTGTCGTRGTDGTTCNPPATSDPRCGGSQSPIPGLPIVSCCDEATGQCGIDLAGTCFANAALGLGTCGNESVDGGEGPDDDAGTPMDAAPEAGSDARGTTGSDAAFRDGSAESASDAQPD